MFLLQSEIFAWDLILLTAMTAFFGLGIGSFVWMARNSMDNAQHILIRFFGTVAFIGFLLVVYASFIEPRIIVVTNAALTQTLAPRIRIAVVSDMHVGPYKNRKFAARVVERINATLPDIVVIPGDFVFTHTANLYDLAPLKDLHAPLGVFAALGNHDLGEYRSIFGKRFAGTNTGDTVEDALTRYGVTVLRNAHVTIATPEGTVAVAGIDDMWTGHFDLAAALRDVPQSAYTIFLSHNPSIVDSPESLRANLIVSGHTHGGQLRLPFLGPLPALPTTLGQSFDHGLFPMDEDTSLLITRGIGESSARTRLFAWPEIFVVDIKPEA